MSAFNYWLFLAGLALFIYSVRLLEESLKALAGRPFKKFLQRQTAHPLKAIFAGAMVTAILQSSSVVMLITLSFVGAGVLSTRNALALVLGSNLGTTFDSWIIAWIGFRLDIESWSFPILSIALIGLLFFGNNRPVGWWTRFLIGFSLLFIGLAYMKHAFSEESAVRWLSYFSEYSPYWFIPLGFLLTALIQSSFATMAIALTMLHTGKLPLDHAAAIVVGAELGTSIKFMLGATKGSTDKQRVAWGNFFFNVLSLLCGAFLLLPLIHFLSERIFSQAPLLVLVSFSSLLNLLVILMTYPVLGMIANLLERLVKPGGGEAFSGDESITADDPQSMLILIRMEAIRLLRETMMLNRRVLGIGTNTHTQTSSELPVRIRIRKWFESGRPFIDDYRRLKMQQGEQLELCADLLREELEPDETDRLNRLITVLRNVTHASKNLKDIRHNLKELKDTANDRLFELSGTLRNEEAEFYTEMERCLQQQLLLQEINWQLKLEENRTDQERRIAEALSMLHEHAISEYEASTLMNIHRGLYSSHKAILHSFLDLALTRTGSAETAK